MERRKQGGLMKKGHKCSLFPYETEEVLSLQDAMQKVGWAITAFNLPDAWNYTQGEDVTIAVIDSGVDLDHPDLVNNLLPGYNFLSPSSPPEDDVGHGTHVTGIICAENNEIGMVGVAPKSKVIPYKVLNKSGNGTLETVAKAIRRAADNKEHKVDIITMSIGSPKPVQQVRKAIQYAASKGIVCFVAAGNAGFTKDIFYPAAYPETIAIGSIDENFDRSSFSCTGKNLDFMAPGGKIFSTVPDNWYAVLSGTSMANPFVAGIAALMLSYSRKTGKITLKTQEDYIQCLKKYTIPVNNPEFAGKEFFQGFGIIDPRKFEEWAKAT